MSILMPLNPVERARATQETAAQFRNRPIDFAKGVTCIHLLRAQMLAFGYSPPAIPHFETVIGAKRALRKMGHRDLAGLLDALLVRKPGAQMRVGDVALLPGAAPFDALVIGAGGKVLGWHDDGKTGLMNIVPLVPFIGVWGLI